DGFKEYTTALLTHYGQWIQPERRQVKGPAPKPRWMPLPQLRYAQVVKTVRRGRLVSVTHRVVFGTLVAVEQVLAPLGWQINTAFVERINLDIRQHMVVSPQRADKSTRSPWPPLQQQHTTDQRAIMASGGSLHYRDGLDVGSCSRSASWRDVERTTSDERRV